MERPQGLYWGAWALLAVLFFGNSGFRQLVQRHWEVRRLRASLETLQADNVRLTNEWRLIQTDPNHTEYLIRKNLGYVRKDEVEYRLQK